MGIVRNQAPRRVCFLLHNGDSFGLLAFVVVVVLVGGGYLSDLWRDCSLIKVSCQMASTDTAGFCIVMVTADSEVMIITFFFISC